MTFLSDTFSKNHALSSIMNELDHTGIDTHNEFDSSSGIVNSNVSSYRYKAIAAGHDHIVALRENDSVVAQGCNYYGQCNIPISLLGVKLLLQDMSIQ